jgi:disulfide oxidoreductase YuzD
MSYYLDVIISYSDLILYMQDLMEKYNIQVYVQKWNNKDFTYYEEVPAGEIDLKLINDKEFRLLILSSKKIPLKKGINLYDTKFSKHAIEVRGGRETRDELEMISFRILSKTPERNIKLFYTNLQKSISEDKDFVQGIKWGEHFYPKIFYHKEAVHKTVWKDFSKKDAPASEPIILK